MLIVEFARIAPYRIFADYLDKLLRDPATPVMQRLGVPPAALPGEEMRGEWAVVTEEIHPGEVGKVELRGTVWSARANRTVHVGERLPVDRIDGLTVWLGFARVASPVKVGTAVERWWSSAGPESETIRGPRLSLRGLRLTRQAPVAAAAASSSWPRPDR